MRCILILFFFPYLLAAQTNTEAAQFFSTALNTPQVSIGTATKVSNFPRVEKMQVRTETNDFDFSKQRYTFRIAPTTIRKRKAQMALYQHLQTPPNEEQQKVYAQEVLDAHTDWLSLYLITEELKIATRLDSILSDQQQVYDKMSASYDFDFQKLVKLQTDKSDLRLSTIELALKQELIEEKYQLETNTFTFTNFVKLATIEQLIATKEGTITSTVPSYEQELLAKEIALEAAEHREFFDFVQVRYAGPHDDFLKERVSVGLAFKLPNAGSQKLKLEELRIKQVEQQREENYDSQEKQKSITELIQSLKKDMVLYQKTENVLEEERENLQKISAQVIKKEGFDPLLLLSIEERQLKNELKLLKQKEDILSDYLKYLARSGRLYNMEQGNWLESN